MPCYLVLSRWPESEPTILRFFANHFALSNSSRYNRSGPEDLTNQTDLLFYRAEDVAAHPDLGFTTDDFIFMALLSGGDYSVSAFNI
jgi:hypothetical protein